MTMDMNDMAKALAGMPDEQRETMMRERLTMFAEMPDAERRGAMGAMVDAVGTLDDDSKRKLIKTRTALLADFPEGQRKTLMMTHMDILKTKPQQQMMAEMQLVQSIIPELSASQRQVIEQAMKMMPMPAMADTGATHGGQVSKSTPTQKTSLAWLWWLIGAAIIVAVVVVIVLLTV